MKKSKNAVEAENHRTLGNNVVPHKYTITFKPNFKTFKFEGHEVISASIRDSTKKIILNAKELEIEKAAIISNGIEYVANVVFDSKEETATLKIDKSISGDVQIKIDFIGVNNDNMYGFYRSKYLEGKETKYMLTTQFEAPNARNAFPCFDEPSFKATFEVSMIVNKDQDCISNMPISSVNDLGGNIREVKFDETPKMSTYLLYLGVGKFDYIKGEAGDTKVRVITTPGKKHLARLPLRYAIDSIKFFEDYFGIKYPLPKVDFIAVPDFAAGAMENWGAITFREADLLINEKSSVAVKQRVAEVIAHELAHQWFGDLVTMKWWNDIWLNESFATFMSYKAMDHIFPEWKIMTEYLRDTIAIAFSADQLKSTHPISMPVKTTADIVQMFDEISYEKGGTVLNMLEQYSGSEIFREGLHKYLKKHSYSNATKFDLWEAIDDAARSKHKSIKVTKVASNWIDKAGYPIIEVKRDKNSVTLKQSRYFLLNNLSDGTKWPVPINYLSNGKEKQVLLEKKSLLINAARDAAIKLNLGQNGLYRVAYNDKDLEMLGEMIRSKKLSGIDAWGVENDLFAMIRSGRSKAEKYLEFVDKHCFGCEYPLNASVLNHLSWLFNIMPNDKKASVKELLLRYSTDIIDNVGWKRGKNEPAHVTMLRSVAIRNAALSGHVPTIENALTLFDNFIKRGQEIDQNLKGAVYSITAMERGASVLNILKTKYKSEELPEEKLMLLSSLGRFNDKKLLLGSLKFTMSKDVRLQDSFRIPAEVASNPAGTELIWPWIKDNWQELKKRYAEGTHMLSRIVGMLRVLNTKEEKADIEKFFGSKENFRDDISKDLNKSLENIEANVQFLNANNK